MDDAPISRPRPLMEIIAELTQLRAESARIAERLTTISAELAQATRRDAIPMSTEAQLPN